MAEPEDAERWLYVHESEVLGAGRTSAIEVVQQAGLTARVVRYDAPPMMLDYQPGRVRLFVGSDEKVRAVMYG